MMIIILVMMIKMLMTFVVVAAFLLFAGSVDARSKPALVAGLTFQNHVLDIVVPYYEPSFIIIYHHQTFSSIINHCWTIKKCSFIIKNSHEPTLTVIISHEP